MKVTFTGTPHQIKKEMTQWLSNNQETTHNESLCDNVTHTLKHYNIKLTQNEKDLLPLTFVKHVCQLQGHEWLQFKDQLEKCGVKHKRTSKKRALTNLALIKEETKCK